MPIPMITDAMISASKTCEDGWSLFEFNGLRTNKSADATSDNLFFEFMCISGPGNSSENAQRKFTHMVNTKGLTSIPDVIGPYIQMLAALCESSQDELKGVDIDPAKLVGKKCWIEVYTDIQDGKTYKKAKAFTPSNVDPN